jgi:hypothetical protein
MGKITVVIEKDENGFGAFTKNTKSVIIGEGATAAEAKQDFLNSFQEVLDSYDSASDIPAELLNPEFEYKYDVSAFFDLFEFLNVSKLAKRIGINPSLMRHYKLGDTYRSDSQARKIESGIHEIAHELLSVTL